MKVATDCYQCLEKSIYQTAELSTKDEQIQAKAVKEGLKALEGNFSPDKVSVTIHGVIIRVIREITQNTDPFFKIKEQEIMVAKELCHGLDDEYDNDFRSCLQLAAKGNAMDFFKPLDAVVEDMKRPVEFAIDDSDQFLAKLRKNGKVLYLADNTGEVLADLPLVTLLSQSTEVVYVVKASSVLNDITLADIRRMGIEGRFSRVITTGTASPGVDFSSVSSEFKREFESADLVIAKGGANYESLSELPARGKFFHCLMAKCKPIANSLKVPLNKYAALLR